MNTETRQDYFNIGCKLLGVYCLIDAIPLLFNLVGTFSAFNNYPSELSASTIPVKIIALLTPVIYALAGFFLLKHGNKLHSIVYQDNAQQGDKIDTFLLFLKMLGVYFLISYTNSFLSVLSNFLFQLFSPDYVDMFNQLQNIYTNFLPSLFGMAVGFYLVMSGKLFVKIGFGDQK